METVCCSGTNRCSKAVAHFLYARNCTWELVFRGRLGKRWMLKRCRCCLVEVPNTKETIWMCKSGEKNGNTWRKQCPGVRLIFRSVLNFDFDYMLICCFRGKKLKIFLLFLRCGACPWHRSVSPENAVGCFLLVHTLKIIGNVFWVIKRKPQF